MQPDLSARASAYSRRFHATTLLRIRWLAVACQFATILFVGLYLGFELPFMPCIVLISISAWLNLFLTFHYPANYRLTPLATTMILGFDSLLLSALLFLTGGLVNPFAILLLAPAAISATSLNVRYIIGLNLLVILCITILAYASFPLPWYPDEPVFKPRLLIDGIWAALVAALIFMTAYGYRVAEETRLLSDALTATELTLQSETHLSILDGLAAAAAHELGTPLATIQLVVKEMAHSLKDKPEFREDIELLSSQSARCRDILKRISSLSTDENDRILNLPLASLIEEVVAPHRDFGIMIDIQRGDCQGDEPIFRRNPGILYGIGNLVENAVDFAKSTVTIRYAWSANDITLTIVDDGKGYLPTIIDRIGEPYMTSRVANQHGGGLGLGLFIAKTLLERSGARLSFQNSRDTKLGAEVRLWWNRKTLGI